MFITIPQDLVRRAADTIPEEDHIGAADLLGHQYNDESVVQFWGLTETSASKELGLNFDIIGRKEGNTSRDLSAYSPPSAELEKAGSLIVSSEPVAESKWPEMSFPAISIFPEDSSSGTTSDDSTTATVNVDDRAWIVKLLIDDPIDRVGDSPVEIEVVHPKRDAQKRIDGLVDTDELADKHVTVVGLGTVGSTVTVELAKSGVGHFSLIDFDRLEIHNVVRHRCGITHLGREKVRAVKDTIGEMNPTASVDSYDFDVTENPDNFRQVASESDLVLVCTDTDVSKLVVNRECLEAEVPAIYAGVYERGMGGDVIRVRPGETPCYDCILGNMKEEMNRGERTTGQDDYTRAGDDQPDPEPGLSIDVGFVSLVQAKYALDTLLPDGEDYTTALDRDMCFWGNREEYIFTRPLQSRFATVSYRSDCRTCGSGREKNDDVNVEEVLKDVEKESEGPRPDDE